MDKLVIMIVVGIMTVGGCVWIFKGSQGLTPTVLTGFENIKDEARSHGYKP